MGSLFGKTLSFARKHFQHLFLIGFCSFGVFFLIGSFSRPEWLDLNSFSSFMNAYRESLRTKASIFPLLQTIGTICGWPITYYVINASIYQKSLKGFIGGFGSKFFPTLGTRSMYVIFSLFLSLLLLVPGMIFVIYWSIARSIVLDNGPWGWRALKKSQEMITNKWRNVFVLNLGLFAVLRIINEILMYMLYLACQLFAWNPIIGLVFHATQFMLNIFIYVFFALLYLHFKEIYIPKVSEKQKKTPIKTSAV